MQTIPVYIIRNTETGKMVDNGSVGAAFEGEDGKARAEELVEIHNRSYRNDEWKVVQEF